MARSPLRIAILGSTGSLGEAVLSVVRTFPDKLRVVGLGAGSNVQLLEHQVQEFKPFLVHFARGLWPAETGDFKGFRISSEKEMVNHPEVDVVVVTSAGPAGLAPTVAALKAGKRVALGNAETMSMAGEVLVDLARQNDTEILPLDAETVGLWQLLQGESARPGRLIFSASWGPTRSQQLSRVPSLTPEEVAVHPIRRLGRKRVIDSMTLMNKAVQVLEAHYLFQVPVDEMTIVYHPENIVRAIVEFQDGTAKALLAPSDPRLAVQTALLFPERIENEMVLRLSLATAGRLTFQPLDVTQYPLLQLGIAAARAGNTYPAVLSAANAVAVDIFLAQQIGLREIPSLVQRVMMAHEAVTHPSLEDILQADRWARDFVETQLQY